MKKLLVLASAISTALLATTTFAADHVWTIASDSVLDGTVNAQAESMNARLHQNRFVIENVNDRSVSTISGYILNGTVDGVNYDTPLINFTNYRGDSTYQYTGQYIGNDQYKGTWYNNTGESGDFLLNADTTTTPPTTPPPSLPPLDTSDIIVTPSTQYGQHPATAIFDGVLGNNNANVWIGLPDDPGASLHLELPEARTFVQYRMSRGYCSAGAYVAGTWKLYGSNDDSNFVLVDDVTTDQGGLMNCTQLNEYTVDSPGAYKYYRFDYDLSSVNTYSHTGVAIGELELVE